MRHYRSLRYFAFYGLLLGAFEAGRLTTSSPPVVNAQDGSTSSPIRLDNVTVTLGMSEAQLMARFGPGYRLEPLGEAGKVLYKNAAYPNMTDDILATLGFSNGRLSRVMKSWVSDQQNIEAFWNGMFSSISSVVGARGSRAMVVAKEPSQPNMNVRQIILTFEGRSIQITRAEQYQNPKVTSFGVSENFPPFPEPN